MCDTSFGLSQAFEWLELLMLGAVGFTHERWQKTFLLELQRYIDTQGRGAHGPESAALSGYLA
ncbi:MAG: hypothetical protein JST48_14260 [Bacteroidetes bacterium]|nr:hypothetical protein [Bacteroidota bacterium]